MKIYMDVVGTSLKHLDASSEYPQVHNTVLALTVKIRKSQDFLAPISGSPGDQIFSLTSRNSTSIFLNCVKHGFME